MAGKGRRPALTSAGLIKMAKDAGAQRVSREAINVLRSVVEEYIKSLVQVALEFARTGGRKTLKASDIKAAAEVLRKR